MKIHSQHHSEGPQISKAIVASLSQIRQASTALRFPSASGDNGRTAKRPATQQPVAWQHNPNPKERFGLLRAGRWARGWTCFFDL
jgi:hypothetical protein